MNIKKDHSNGWRFDGVQSIVLVRIVKIEEKQYCVQCIKGKKKK